MALALIGHDVATVADTDLGAPTPCTGWTVADLIEHMNERHEAVIATVFAPLEDHADDPRDGFARTAARWVVAMEQVGGVVHLPEAGAMATDVVLSVHFVDMLTHRWDLSRALGRPCTVPDRLTAIALPIARSITGPGSPLNGPGGVYRRALKEDPALSAMDNIAALLGRDPRWQAADVPK
ncbi:TIGR03086 family protein [Nocardia amamiensis]|uniref:TIGR03086 family protein n=2 Tax=Nocardia amamiensis TaxID=404578 RepID=A0ABS0CQM4_9NOCA|nr:TIGR03086 family protein [Nocardia amamiensis]